MGSFAFSCGISNLPIEYGDEVRYILLSSNPYTRKLLTDGLWFPRGFPIQAKYNGYGSVDAEGSVGRDLLMECLKIDLLSVGVGANTIHDVATSKEMSWEDLLNAIRENRVHVRQDVGNSISDVYRTPKGVPTMKRIRRALARFDVGQNGQFVINKVRYGVIRIRWDGHGNAWNKDIEYLEKAQQHLAKYATVLKACSYGQSRAELLVYPKPGVEFAEFRISKKPLTVDQLMIREDVWQELLNIVVGKESLDNKGLTIDDHRQYVTDFYRECLRRGKHYRDWSFNHPVGFIANDDVPFTVGLGTSWWKLVEKGLPESEVSDVLSSVAEMIHVMQVAFSVRYQWRPSTACGPQFGEWDCHVVMNKIFVAIANHIANHKGPHGSHT